MLNLKKKSEKMVKNNLFINTQNHQYRSNIVANEVWQSCINWNMKWTMITED